MQVLAVLNNTLKISYNPDTDNLCLGDLLSFSMPSQLGIIAQIFKLEFDGGYNIAHLRIFFTIKNKKWIKWIGNIPSKSTSIEKIEEIDIYEFFNQGMYDPFLVGFMPQYERNFRISINSLRNIFVLFGNNKNKIDILKQLQSSIIKSGKRFVLFDIHNTITSAAVDVHHINALNDFKLPLNIITLKAIYNKHFNNSSPEMRMLFEDVISQINNFFQKSGEVFVPFNIFKSVVDNAKPSIELSLLKNLLKSYKEKNIFANNKSDFEKFQSILKHHNSYSINLSFVPEDWRKDYIEFVINSIENTFIILEDNKYFNTNKELQQFIANDKNKLIIATNYTSDHIGEYLRNAQNLILSQPNKQLSYFPNLHEYLNVLSDEEYIFQGEQSNFIPLILRPISEFENTQKPIRKPKEPEVVFTPSTPEPIAIPEKMAAETIQQVPPQVELTKVPPVISQKELKENIPHQTEPEKEETPPVETAEKEEPQQSLQNEPIKEKEESFEANYEEIIEDADFDEEFLEELQEQKIEPPHQEIVEFEEVPFDDEEPEEQTEQSHQKIQENILEEIFEEQPITKIENEFETITAAQKPEPNPQIFYDKQEAIPEYPAPARPKPSKNFEKEDIILHPKYGQGTIKRIVSHGNRKLYKIQFNDDIKLIDLESINVKKLS